MFLDVGKTKYDKDCNPSCSCGKYIEVGNDVFMEYVSADGKISKAAQHNVDTGMGFERMLLMCNGLKSVYETEIFAPAIKLIGENTEASRIIAEHLRASMFIISDGVVPTNSGAGYVLRRLIRRAVRMAKKIGFNNYEAVLDTYLGLYSKYYNLDKAIILKVLLDEVAKFEKTLEQGIKEFEKVAKFATDKKLSGKTVFRLYETYGFPVELTQELAQEAGLSINMAEYEEAKAKHATLSATASAGAFKGGLADTSNATAHLHTATHLLLAVLREIYGDQVIQRGSNITPERLRFDFNIDHKLEPTEIAEIENRVNAYIKQNLKIKVQEMSVERAKNIGAVGTFSDRYGDMVKVYNVGCISCEICGGPHAQNTSELGTFKIIKEESVSAGVRRIKGILS